MAQRLASSTLILAAHGTRKSAGVTLLEQLASDAGKALRAPVYLAFVDVLGPTPEELLCGAPGEQPAVIVPALLVRGHHALTDLPRRAAASGHHDVTLTPILGRFGGIVPMLVEGLHHSGWRPGDAVILAGAGTRHPSGRADLMRTRRILARALRTPVTLAFAAGKPYVATAVAGLRHRGVLRISVVSYLISDGLFQDQLEESGADIVTRPLGYNPKLVDLVVERFALARSWAA